MRADGGLLLVPLAALAGGRARLDVLGPSAAVSVDVLLPLMRVRVLGFGLTGTSVELKRFMLDVTTRVASAAAAATGPGCGPAVVSKSFPIYSILRGAAAGHG